MRIWELFIEEKVEESFKEINDNDDVSDLFNSRNEWGLFNLQHTM